MLDVSYQTVYNHMNKNEVEMVGCIFKKLGTTHINQDGIDILKKSMGLIQVPTVKKDVSLEDVIEKISDRVNLKVHEKFEEVKEDNKKDYNDLKDEVELLKKQNEELKEMIQEQNNKSFWDIFKKK